MRKWTIVGLEGLCDDWGYCEPYNAAEAIRSRQAKEDLTESEVEEIAKNFNCRVCWDSTQ